MNREEVKKESLKDWLIRWLIVPFLPTFEWKDEGYVGRYKACKLNHKIYLVSFEREEPKRTWNFRDKLFSFLLGLIVFGLLVWLRGL